MPSSPDPGGELRPPLPYAAPRRRRGELLTGFAVRIRTRWGLPTAGPGAPLDFRNQELSSWTTENINLGSPETFSPGSQVPARPGHRVVSDLEDPGPRVRSGAGRKNRARPHKMS